MNFDNLKIDEFKTKILVSSGLSKKYMLINNNKAILKSENSIALYDYKLLDYYYNSFEEIKLFGLTKDEYFDFKKRNINHTKINIKYPMLILDKEFFELNGAKYEKIRRYRNYYTKKLPLTITNEPYSMQQVIDFIREWKIIRKDAHFQFFIGYDINFLEKYYNRFKDNLISRYFYDKDRLIGFSIIEKIDKNKYNLLIRKSNTEYPNSCLFIDYFMFNEIFKEVQESFIVNMGSDGGKKGIYNYKTDTFHVEIKSVDLFDVKINKNKQPIKDNSIKININDFRMLVNPCSSYFIINHCKAKCCQYNAYKLKHPLIMPFDDEIKVFEKVDCKYDDEYKIIRLKENICPFQERPSGFCKLHNTEFKPFGCKIMPLRLVKNEIRVANFLKSYNCQKQKFSGIDKVPFYKGFNQSLIALFGEKETERIINQIELGKVDITVNIHPSNIEKLYEINRIIKKLSKEQK